MGITLSREIRYGVAACLVGTFAMDLVVGLEFYATGQPLHTSLMLFGALIGRGVFEGTILHILFGTMLGVVWGAAISRFEALRIDSMGKGLRLGVAAGLITIPMGCVPFALVVGVPLVTMIPMVTLPHLAWGLVMGWGTSYLLLKDEA